MITLCKSCSTSFLMDFVFGCWEHFSTFWLLGLFRLSKLSFFIKESHFSIKSAKSRSFPLRGLSLEWRIETPDSLPPKFHLIIHANIKYRLKFWKRQLPLLPLCHHCAQPPNHSSCSSCYCTLPDFTHIIHAFAYTPGFIISSYHIFIIYHWCYLGNKKSLKCLLIKSPHFA